MSQALLDAHVPAIAEAVTALCPHPRDVACLERVSAGARPDMLVWRVSDTWTSPVEDLPLTPDQRARLLQAADAMAEAGVHRLFRVPGAWCALGADPFSPALLPTDAPPPRSRAFSRLLRAALAHDVEAILLGGAIPTPLADGLSAHRRLRLEDDQARLRHALDDLPDTPTLVWRRGTIALALSAVLLPDRILPVQCLAVVHRR